MFAELFFVAVLIIGSIAANYTDFKRREVPDWINYFLIIIGIGGHGIVSLISNSYEPLLFSVSAAFIFYLIANLMYYSGSWGGGDAKFLVAMGSLLPVYPSSFISFFNPNFAEWPFLMSLLFNIIFFGAIFGVLYSFYAALKNKNNIIDKVKKILNTRFMKVMRLLLLFSVFFIFIYSILTGKHFYFLFLLWFAIVMLFYILVLSKSVEDINMLKKVKPSDLTEGDWIAEDIKVKNRTIYRKRKTGIELGEISKLKKLEKEGVLNKVKIKEGLPFLPSFLTGIVFTLVFGDMMYIILNSMFI